MGSFNIPLKFRGDLANKNEDLEGKEPEALDDIAFTIWFFAVYQIFWG